MTNVAHNADDLVRLVRLPIPVTRRLPNASSFGKAALTSSWLTMTTLSLRLHFLLGEIASAQQRNSQRAEIVLVHATKVSAKAYRFERPGDGLRR